MSGQGPVVSPRTADWPLVAACAVLCGVGACAVAMWSVVAVACWSSGVPVPRCELSAALFSWWWPSDVDARWGAPVSRTWPPTVIRVAAAVVAAGLLAALWRMWRWFSRWSEPADTGRPGRRVPGTASAGQVRDAAGEKTVLARAAHLRPGLDRPQITDVAYLLGQARGHQVWASVEDSMIVIGPPRSGKGLHLVVNAILDAPGAVVTTSTRPDNLKLTLAARAGRGPVAVFDTQQVAPGVPGGARWCPVRGCEDPQTAMVRARGFAAGSGMGAGGVSDGGFWQQQAEVVIRCLLHAAALAGRDALDLYRWSLDPVAAATEAHPTLVDDPRAAMGWASALQAICEADPRSRDSVWLGVRGAFAALGDPRTLAAVRPRTQADQFNCERFLREQGTLYLLATPAMAELAGPLIGALIEDINHTATRLAGGSPGGRLDPPVAFILDEIANFVALPSLPSMMSQGGGSGVTTLVVFQSLDQAREKWSREIAGALWDSAIVKVILGGMSNESDLREWSGLIGERDETQVQVSHGTRGALDRSESWSVRRVPILAPSDLRTLPMGKAVLLLRSAPAIMLDLRAWTRRSDAGRLRADVSNLESAIGAAGDA
ncbi:MAG: TraM recognition domain-containing protein [Microbacterium sp.]